MVIRGFNLRFLFFTSAPFWFWGCSAITPPASTKIPDKTQNLAKQPLSPVASPDMQLVAISDSEHPPIPGDINDKPTMIGQMEAANQEKERARMLAFCAQILDELPGKSAGLSTQQLCLQANFLPDCESVEKRPIFHYDFQSQRPSTAKRVLVMAVVHGDELESGSVARRWVERLMTINSRNTWRIIPILNPDGMKRYSRTNANGVDLNRNFPSTDWDELAQKWWKERRNSNPRQFPGDTAGSEPETQCAMRHIDDFQPDFIVAVHTPYGVLDFDGPVITAPRYESLPWVNLGTFPGSLGRYMWKDHQVPVLTVELKDSEILKKIDDIDALQDIAGTVAIRSVDSL